jgi:hypothetical protein
MAAFTTAKTETLSPRVERFLILLLRALQAKEPTEREARKTGAAMAADKYRSRKPEAIYRHG